MSAPCIFSEGGEVRAGSLDLNEGISGSGMVGLRMDLGGGLAFAARD